MCLSTEQSNLILDEEIWITKEIKFSDNENNNLDLWFYIFCIILILKNLFGILPFIKNWGKNAKYMQEKQNLINKDNKISS